MFFFQLTNSLKLKPFKESSTRTIENEILAKNKKNTYLHYIKQINNIKHSHTVIIPEALSLIMALYKQNINNNHS